MKYLNEINACLLGENRASDTAQVTETKIMTSSNKGQWFCAFRQGG